MNSIVSWQSTRSSKCKNILHLVFVTKYRRPVFDAEMLTFCEALMQNICTSNNVLLYEFNGERDHVHLMVQVPPTVAIAVIVKKLKGSSSRYLRKRYWNKIKPYLWGNHFWSPSYCCVSCGGATIEKIRKYIASQDRPS